MITEMNSRDASPYLMACPAAVLLMVYAVVNGVPFVYPDAFVYFAYGESAWQKVGDAFGSLMPADGSANISVAPADRVPAAAVDEAPAAFMSGSDSSDDGWTPATGRSVYYGLLSALPGPFAPPWNGIVLQAYSSALIVAFVWRATVGTIGFGYVTVMGALGIVTTFGIFASTAMPDVWAAHGILAVAVLVAFRDRIGQIDEIVLWIVVLFAALAHSTHLAVLATLTAILVAARTVRPTAIPKGTIGKTAAILALTVGLGAGARLAVEHAAGRPPLGMPFLTAHLVDGGPGMEFIRNACPDAGFAVCERADRIPVGWREFIFRFSESEDYTRRLADEDASFALATLRHSPAAVTRLALRDAARQITMIGLATTPIRAAIGESAAAEHSPGPLAQRVREGRLYDAGWLYTAISRLNTVLVLAGILALAFVAMGPACETGGRNTRGLRRLLAVSLSGILLNAAICGILASPYDRFQARVAWLIPVLSLIAIAACLRERRPHLFRKESSST